MVNGKESSHVFAMENLIDAIYGTPTPGMCWSGAIVMQGQYYAIHTEIAVREFLERNPNDVLVILSSYLPSNPRSLLSDFEYSQLKNPSSKFYGRFLCISCHTPDVKTYPDFWK